MKTFFSVLKTTFLTVGSIIGAGFITGRELVSFFGSDGFLPFLLFSAILFFLAFSLAYYLGSKYGGSEKINAVLFYNPKIVGGALVISSFFSLSATLSAIDILFHVMGLPVLSVLCLALSCAFLGKGVGFMEKASLVLVPPVLFSVIFTVMSSGGLDFGAGFSGNLALKTVKSFLYVFMNIFVNFPVISAAANGKDKKTLTVSAAVVSAVLFFIGLMICAAVKYSGDGAQNAPMPIIAAFSGKGLYPFLATAILCSLITSVFTAFYPIYLVAEKRAGIIGTVIAAAVCFLFSRLGVKAIVDYAYPVSGAFGGVYLIRGAVFYIKTRKGIKEKKRTIIGLGGNNMCAKRKSKNRPKKLSDEDYEKYIMALKDEAPPKLMQKIKK